MEEGHYDPPPNLFYFLPRWCYMAQLLSKVIYFHIERMVMIDG